MTNYVKCVTHIFSLSLQMPCNVFVQLHAVDVTASLFMVKIVLNFAFHKSRDNSVHLYVSPVIYNHGYERKDLSNSYLMSSIPKDIFNVAKTHDD